jgi:hypothetical protein
VDDDHRSELMEHYMRSYALLTGRTFEPDTTPPLERIEGNLRRYFSL